MEDLVFSGAKVITLPVQHEAAFSPTRNWCDWDRMHGREYLVPSVLLLSRNRVKQLAQLTEQAYQLFQKTMRYVQREIPDSYLVHQLGIPELLLESARRYVPCEAITRFDIAVGEEQMFILEYNTDTPTGVVEASYVADSLIQRYTYYENPSKNLNARIKNAVQNCVKFYRQQGFHGEVVFSATQHSNEDIGTVRYTQQVSQVPSHYSHLENLRLHPDGLYAGNDRAAIWYRLYPWEHLPHDVDEDGFPVGEAVIEAINENRLATISPPQSVITQSKGLQALIWELAQLNHTLFDASERAIIQRYLLPTSFERDSFRSQGTPYVSKPLFGREGGAVTLYDATGQAEEQDQADFYWNQQMIYQQRVTLPSVKLATEEGIHNGFLLLGAFCVGGKFAGLLPRVGGPVTDNLAYFLPAAFV